jgi:hypothetical protein
MFCKSREPHVREQRARCGSGGEARMYQRMHASPLTPARRSLQSFGQV